MANGNGNGTGNGNGDGHAGKTSHGMVAALEDPHERRLVRRVIMDMIQTSDETPAEVWRALVASCVSDMKSDQVGARRSGRSHLLQIRQMALDASVALDRITRLDDQQATEIIGEQTIELEFDDRT